MQYSYGSDCWPNAKLVWRHKRKKKPLDHVFKIGLEKESIRLERENSSGKPECWLHYCSLSQELETSPFLAQIFNCNSLQLSMFIKCVLCWRGITAAMAEIQNTMVPTAFQENSKAKFIHISSHFTKTFITFISISLIAVLCSKPTLCLFYRKEGWEIMIHPSLPTRSVTGWELEHKDHRIRPESYWLRTSLRITADNMNCVQNAAIHPLAELWKWSYIHCCSNYIHFQVQFEVDFKLVVRFWTR